MCSSACAVSRHELEEAPGLEKRANPIRGENVPSNLLPLVFAAALFVLFWNGFTKSVGGGKKIKAAAL